MAGAAGSARVSAQLGGEGVAFAGDLLTCHVTVEGVGAALTLGRGLAQVVGHAVFDTSLLKESAFVNIPIDVRTGDTLRSSDRSACFFATLPVTIFDSLVVLPSHQHQYTFKAVLPSTLPPSHRGRALRISYRVVITVHRDGAKPDVLMAPFRLLQAVADNGATHVFDFKTPCLLSSQSCIAFSQDEYTQRQKLMQLRLANPAAAARVLRSPASEAPDVHDLLPTFKPLATLNNVNYIVQNASGHRVYNISAPDGTEVARLLLTHSCVRLGDVFSCVVAFTYGAPCVHLSVFLESAEAAASEEVAARTGDAVARLGRQVASQHHELTPNAREVAAVLAVPVQASTSFETSAVKLSWSVRVEIATARGGVLQQTAVQPEGAVTRFAPSTNADIFSCSAPITVLPTSPENARIGPSMREITIASA